MKAFCTGQQAFESSSLGPPPYSSTSPHTTRSTSPIRPSGCSPSFCDILTSRLPRAALSDSPSGLQVPAFFNAFELPLCGTLSWWQVRPALGLGCQSSQGPLGLMRGFYHARVRHLDVDVIMSPFSQVDAPAAPPFSIQCRFTHQGHPKCKIVPSGSLSLPHMHSTARLQWQPSHHRTGGRGFFPLAGRPSETQ